MATQVILLERIENLGAMGDIVDVKPGYARNFLLPQSKALRATKDNIAYFETQKSSLQKVNNEKKKAAEAVAKNLNGLKIVIIRQAGEGGHLYGSVAGRDVADAINLVSTDKVERNMVVLNQNIKTIGLFNVDVALHAEVKIKVSVNIARTEDEAKKQEKLGQAILAKNEEEAADIADMKANLMDKDALDAENAAAAEESEKSAEASAKAKVKAEAKAGKKAKAKAEPDAEISAESDQE